MVNSFGNKSHEGSIFVAGESPVPVSGKVIDEQEIVYMIEAALDGWLTTGRFNKEFEKNLAEFLGVKHVLTVNSGSSANLVAFSTMTSSKLGSRAIKQGDEVIGVATEFNKEFEKNLAEFLGVKHVLTVNSGSSANLVAYYDFKQIRL